MNKLDRCKKKKKGIEIVEPNENLAESYVTEEVKFESEDSVKDFRLKCKELLERTDFEEVREEIVSRLE